MSTAHPPSVRRPAGHRSFCHRPWRTVPALILGVALVLAGATALWLLGARALDGRWPAQATGSVDAAGAVDLADPAVLAVGIGLAVLGLLALLAGIVPGAPGQSLLRDGVDAVPGETVLSHRDLARRLRATLSRLDGVSGARVQVSGRRIRASVTTPVDDRTSVDAHARATAQAAVDALGLVPAPRLHLTTRSGR